MPEVGRCMLGSSKLTLGQSVFFLQLWLRAPSLPFLAPRSLCKLLHPHLWVSGGPRLSCATRALLPAGHFPCCFWRDCQSLQYLGLVGSWWLLGNTCLFLLCASVWKIDLPSAQGGGNGRDQLDLT